MSNSVKKVEKTENAVDFSGLVEALVENSHFAGKKVDKGQISAKALRKWSETVEKLRIASYDVYSQFENDNIRLEAVDSVKLDEIFDIVRLLFAMCPTKNGKIHANAAIIELCIAYSGCRKVVNSVEMAEAKSNLRTYRKKLSEAVENEAVTAEYVESLKELVEKWTDEVERLSEIADNRLTVPKPVAQARFRVEFEQMIGRKLENRLCMTKDELLAEKKAKADERKAKRVENKQKKAKADKNQQK